MTPDEIATIAFYLIAPTGIPLQAFQGRVDEIAAHIRSYGAACAAADRERIQRVLCRYCVDGDRPDHGYHWISSSTGAPPVAVVCRAAIIT